jgi:Ran GTPase-activating protein (RanGAP) involved in mRNA processing and transport
VAGCGTLVEQAAEIGRAAPVQRATARGRVETATRQGRIPWLRELSFGPLQVNRQLGDLIGSPLFSTLHTLDLSNQGLDRYALQGLAASPHLGGLTTLTLDANYLGDDGMQAFVSPLSLRNLTTLRIRGGGYQAYDEDPALHNDGARTLARCAALRNLERLDLAGNEIGGAGIRALLESSYLTGVRVLNLSDNDIDGRDAEEFARASGMAALEYLDLSENGIGDSGLTHLARARRSLLKLSRLDLRACEITEPGVAALAKSPLLQNLRSLTLGQNALGPRSAERLAAAPMRLEFLDLADADLGDRGVRHLAQSAGLGRLAVLNLARNGLGSTAATALAQSPHFDQLQVLDLARNKLDGAATAVLVHAAWASNLRRLLLNGNPVGPTGATALAESPHLSRLTVLELDEAELEDVGLLALAQSTSLQNLRKVGLMYNSCRPETQQILQLRFGKDCWTDIPF